MNRYDEAIQRAVSAMPMDAEQRRATYDRARIAMTTRLRSVMPPLPQAAIEAEQDALEAAIQRVEQEFARPAVEAPEPQWLPPEPSGMRRYRPYIIAVGCAAIVAALIAGYFGHTSKKDRVAATQSNIAATRSTVADTRSNAPADTRTTKVSYVLMRQLVHYRTTNPVGSLVIDKAQRHLYVIQANVSAIRYSIALGGDCTTAAGPYVVSRRLGEPDATRIALSDASSQRVLYLDSDVRRIHGTDASAAIGGSVRLGCFQLMLTDMAELFGRVPVGTRVLVN